MNERRPKPFKLSRANKIEVCEAIPGDYPLRPHIFGTIDYLQTKDIPALIEWLKEAQHWLKAQPMKRRRVSAVEGGRNASKADE